jgi:hypothetical protein
MVWDVVFELKNFLHIGVVLRTFSKSQPQTLDTAQMSIIAQAGPLGKNGSPMAR